MPIDRLTATLQRRCSEISEAALALGLAVAEQSDSILTLDLCRAILAMDAAHDAISRCYDALATVADREPSEDGPRSSNVDFERSLPVADDDLAGLPFVGSLGSGACL